MIIPIWSEINERMHLFKERERVTWRLVLQPRDLMRIIVKYRYLNFFIVGIGGVVLALFTTWGLTSFVFGLERYFIAYLIGVAVALSFNFVMYSLTVFNTAKDHIKRFVVFIAYSVGMTGLQAFFVHTLTTLVGVEWYLLVIAFVVFFASFFNFILFKLSLFRENSR